MKKVEIVALAERWQAKADRAMERYQESGLARHNREREQAQDLADALRIAAGAADDHDELVNLRMMLKKLAGKAHTALDAMSAPEQPSDRTILTGLAREVISAARLIVRCPHPASCRNGGLTMTREEAIKELEELKAAYDIPAKSAKNETFRIEFENAAKAVSFALAALRGPTREQVEKVWRGEWIGSADGYADGKLVYDIWECSECGYVINEEDDPDMLPQFCPKCYAAMTDAAVDVVMKRLEALKDGI